MIPIGTTTITNNAQSRFGFGALSGICDALSGLGIKRPLICSDKGLRDVGLIDRLLDELPGSMPATVFDATPPNPTESAINDASYLYQDCNCDGVITIGGGASIDLGKAVALRTTHSEPLQSYITQNRGTEKISNVAPIVAIPTTAGTGSEVARASVVILDNGEKRVITSPMLIPRLSILDPELTLSLPPYLTAATGMDAVTHCIEAVISPIVNPPAEAIGLDGIERALGNGALQSAVSNGSDRDARWTMMLVSTEGAMAFSKGLGAVHAMSHACGKDLDLKLHHGTLNAVLLPSVLRYNYEYARDKYPKIARAMGLPPDADLATAITVLNAELGLPDGLGAMGISADMVLDLATHAVDDMCTATNPAPLDKAGYVRLFEMALSSSNIT